MKALWILFIAGQIINAGNMNYQQDMGYYETTPYYSRHPSKSEVYLVKVGGTIAVYATTKILPKHETLILLGANVVVWGFVYDDYKKGIALNLRF
ncbi:hypothetical protein KAR91_52025 [Candidatus Pacearchaeota archaeon]|nr:hypothetical protein [Candidatus Pacearchaeota archaeon]